MLEKGKCIVISAWRRRTQKYEYTWSHFLFWFVIFLGDIPEALQNECARCNEKHKEGVRKVIHHLIKNKPKWWQELETKFDPKGEYKKKYKNLLKDEGLPS